MNKYMLKCDFYSSLLTPLAIFHLILHMHFIINLEHLQLVKSTQDCIKLHSMSSRCPQSCGAETAPSLHSVSRFPLICLPPVPGLSPCIHPVPSLISLPVESHLNTSAHNRHLSPRRWGGTTHTTVAGCCGRSCCLCQHHMA